MSIKIVSLWYKGGATYARMVGCLSAKDGGRKYGAVLDGRFHCVNSWHKYSLISSQCPYSGNACLAKK